MSMKTLRFRISLCDLSALYVLIWIVTPAMGSASIFRAILLACAAYWGISNGFFIKKHAKELLLMIILLLGYFITQWMSHGVSYAVSWTINLGVFVVVGLIGMKYNYEYKDKIPVLLNIVLFIVVIVSIISIRTVIADPYALRRATYSLEDRGHAYGSYGFIYMMTQLLPLIFFLLVNKPKERYGINKVLLIVTFAIGWFLVIQSGFFIANVVLISSFILIILLKDFNTKKLLIILLLIVVFAFSYRYVVEILFSGLSRIVEGKIVYERKVNDLYNQFILGYDNDGIGLVRFDLYKKSWTAVLHNFIFGSAIIRGEDASGGHSTFVDIMANCGLVVALLYYWLIIRMPIKMAVMLDEAKRHRQLIVVFLFLVFSIGIFDTIPISCSWVWFLFLPYISNSTSIYKNAMD